MDKLVLRRLSHAGILVRNLEDAIQLWTTTFGLRVSHAVPGTEAEGIRSVFLSTGDGFIELIEPIDHTDMTNAVARRLATSGEGIYHLALVVDDVAEAGRFLSERGLTLVRLPATVDQPNGRWLVHPRSASGALLELIAPPRA